MNPQFDQSPGLHLPQPSVDGERAAYDPAFFGNPVAPQIPAQPMSPVPAAPTPAYQQPAPVVPQSQSSDDGDIVDDEWVNKAHDIASRYHADPYMQARELSKLKAQYIKARYNKDIKVSEDRS